MERDFKGIWIPKEVWLDKNLKANEKILLVEIDSLDNANGCWASNDYFADFFGLSKDRISRLISTLKEKGYITVELQYKNNTKQVEKRIIRVKDLYKRNPRGGIGENNNTPTGGVNDTPIGGNAKDNNTSFNNIKSMSSKSSDKKEVKEENKKVCKTNVYKEITDYLNDKAGRNFSYKNKSTQSQINGRMSEGRTVDDFKAVIDLKVAQWGNDDKMKTYLRPATLFAPTNFENYINEALTTASKKKSNLPSDAPSMKSFDLDEF